MHHDVIYRKLESIIDVLCAGGRSKCRVCAVNFQLLMDIYLFDDFRRSQS